MLSGFYKKSVEERLQLIQQHAPLTEEETATLRNSGALDTGRADRMIENVIGAIHLPLGIATHFKINGKEHLVPMAIEEPSVVAAASKAAKLCLPDGFAAKADEPIMRGQIQIVQPKVHALELLKKNHDELFQIAKSYGKPLEPFGGGLREMKFRELKGERGTMVIVEVFVDVRDAMGANTINTMVEKLAPSLVNYAGGTPRLRIISNLATERKAYATAVWKKETIGEEGIEAVLDGYALARIDPYRCATHNKGIMNGIDAVALATSNDWRGVEAGAHSYAALNGYHSLTHYEKNKTGDLVGTIELPLVAATVGGAINTSPTGKIALKIAGVKTSQELAMLMACVGLANNFAALYALTTTGIQAGHMKLHAKNLAVMAGAEGKEIDQVVEQLAKAGEYTFPKAQEALRRIRNGN